MNYDKNNIFAKILRGEIPCTKVFENEYSLAFKDISPQAKIHILVIPKGAYTDIDDFYTRASEKEIISFSNAVKEVLKLTGVSQQSGGNGFRAIANTGSDGIQEVPHFHLHILGGENLGLRGLRKS